MIPATILIPARDCASTIQRAVWSAASQRAIRVILIDDWSSDATVALARAALPDLEVVRPVEHRTLGFVRQVGLEHTTTDFLVWLDADDELLPGRVGRLVTALGDTGSDFASDPVELYDGVGGGPLGILRIPGFLKADVTLSRLFERNYLPAPGAVACRTSRALSIGFDTALHGGEDFDHLLRGIPLGATWCLGDSSGYRQWAYPSSVSRDLANQRVMLDRALRKHDYPEAHRCLSAAGWPDRVVAWALVSMAVFRSDWTFALAQLDTLERDNLPAGAVLEPDGPCPLPEAWRVAFHRGTIHALMGSADTAEPYLRAAVSIEAAPEAVNNLGVAFAMRGECGRAKGFFQDALKRFPAYSDARRNLADPTSCLLSSHPLRRDRWRDGYPEQA